MKGEGRSIRLLSAWLATLAILLAGALSSAHGLLALEARLFGGMPICAAEPGPGSLPTSEHDGATTPSCPACLLVRSVEVATPDAAIVPLAAVPARVSSHPLARTAPLPGRPPHRVPPVRGPPRPALA